MMKFDELCQELQSKGVQSIYLIHNEDKEAETRKFAKRLAERGFIPIVAADYRKRGSQAVSDAIKRCQLSIVMAFNENEVDKAINAGVPFFLDVEDEQ